MGKGYILYTWFEDKQWKAEGMELREISYFYGRSQVLENINLVIEERMFTVLFGADEAGKTTLLHIILGFLPLYQGSVTWETDELKKVRYIPDDIIRERNMTVCRYLGYAKKACPAYDKEMERQLCQDFAVPVKTQLLELTYRENKMVQIIAALCAKPEFLILDEPVNFLDRETYLKVLELLQAQNKKGMGILLAAEKYADAKNFGSHYAYMKEGKIIAAGEIPIPDYRKKVITVVDGKQKPMENLLKQIAGFDSGKEAYLYQGSMEGLPAVLQSMDSKDFTVEAMTLEEELEMDFSRWEER